MTNFVPFSYPISSEDRSWLLTELEDAYKVGVTLDLSTFNAAQHFKDGMFIPSGTAVGLISAQSTSGQRVVGPYLDAASDGRQTALGYLASEVRVVNPNTFQVLTTKVAAAVVVAFAAVDPNRLPFTSTNAAAGGYIDANGQVDLKNIYHITNAA